MPFLDHLRRSIAREAENDAIDRPVEDDEATAEARRLLAEDDEWVGAWLLGDANEDHVHPDVLYELRRIIAEQIVEDDALIAADERRQKAADRE